MYQYSGPKQSRVWDGGPMRHRRHPPERTPCTPSHGSRIDPVTASNAMRKVRPFCLYSFLRRISSKNYDTKIYTIYITNYMLSHFRLQIEDIRMLALRRCKYFRIASSDTITDTIIIRFDTHWHSFIISSCERT